MENLDKIAEKDPAMYKSLCQIIDYLASTYGEKYAKSELNNEGIIYSPNLGKGFNMGNATKYISRYITTGFSKSEMPDDLKKSIHYCLFEYTRKVNKDATGI